MYAVLDIEANGGKFGEEKIIEIAVLRYDGEKVTDELFALVNPEASINPYVEKLTGIYSHHLKSAPKFPQVARRILEITEGCILVGHNVGFDYRMLQQSFQDLGYRYERETIDTLPLAEKLIPGIPSYGLSKLCDALAIPLLKAHRAGDDARATLELFKILLLKDPSGEIFAQQKDLEYSNIQLKRLKNWLKEAPLDRSIAHFLHTSGKTNQRFFSYTKNDLADFLGKMILQYPKEVENIENISFERTGNQLCSALMCYSKSLHFSVQFPYELVFHEGEWGKTPLDIERVNLKQNLLGETAQLCLQSASQASKLIQHITSQNYTEWENVAARSSVKHDESLLIGHGRNRGEKLFIHQKQGIPKAFGFYQLFHQISSEEKFQSRAVILPEEVPWQLIQLLRMGLLQKNLQEKTLE